MIGVSALAALARPLASRHTGCTSGAPLKASTWPNSSSTDFCRPAGMPTAVQYTCCWCSDDGNSARCSREAASS
ncbi:MAG: hypothetical protein A2213_05740 [Lysobacterales bacterium RIFOXYA1_FULL_68_6]|nr:MAG: hypothetical protein A2213_05740 [Xanthomonadales bacterium RIFOXYA1_FULL_68_6]